MITSPSEGTTLEAGQDIPLTIKVRDDILPAQSDKLMVEVRGDNVVQLLRKNDVGVLVPIPEIPDEDRTNEARVEFKIPLARLENLRLKATGKGSFVVSARLPEHRISETQTLPPFYKERIVTTTGVNLLQIVGTFDSELYVGEKVENLRVTAVAQQGSPVVLQETKVKSSDASRLSIYKGAVPAAGGRSTSGEARLEPTDNFSLVALQSGEVTLTLEGGGTSVPVKVLIKNTSLDVEPKTLLLDKGASKEIVATVRSPQGETVTTPIMWKSKNESVVPSPTATAMKVTLEGKDVGTTTVTASYQEGGITIQDSVIVEVRSKLQNINLNESPNVLLNQTARFSLRLDGPDAFIRDLRERDVFIKSLKPDFLRIGQDPKDPLSFTARGLKLGQAEVEIKVGDMTQLVLFDIQSIDSFKPLTVTLSPIGRDYVRRNYGAKTDEAYRVVKVTFTNNLSRPDTGTLTGDSVLVYSEAVKAPVKLEKRYNPRSDSKILVRENNGTKLKKPEAPDPYWEPVEENDFIAELTLSTADAVNAVPSEDAGSGARHEAEKVKVFGVNHNFLVTYPGAERTGFDPNIKWTSSAPNIVEFTDEVTGEAKTVADGDATLIGRVQGQFYAVFVSVDSNAVAPDTSEIVSARKIPHLDFGSYATLFTAKDNSGVPIKLKWKLDPPLAPNSEESTPVHIYGNTGVIRGQNFGTATIMGIVTTAGNGVAVGDKYATVVNVVPGNPNAKLPRLVFRDNGRFKIYRHQALYQAYGADILLDDFDARANQTNRAKISRGVNVLTALGSFLTATNALRGSGPNVLDNLGNLLIPSIERTFPDTRETQRKNIMGKIMPPVVEVGPGENKNYIMFFPRGSFDDVIRGYDVRIAEITTSPFNVEVAVIKKLTGTVEGIVESPIR